MLLTQSKISAVFTVGVLYLTTAFSAYGQAQLDFQVKGFGFPGPCNISGTATSTVFCPTAGAAEEVDPDTTPFTQELVTIDGVSYWHQIIGDPAKGFALEVYIREKPSLAGSAGTELGLLSDSGGRPSNFPGSIYRQDMDVVAGNGWDPLGMGSLRDFKDTGNGTADPTKIIMRQVMGGTWNSVNNTWSCGSAEFCMTFTKSSLSQKPRITQTVNDAAQGLTAFFDLDMSNSNYTDNTTAGNIINTLAFSKGDEGFKKAAGFNMATDEGQVRITAGGRMETEGQNIRLTGGRYTYEAGRGWIDPGIDSGYQTWEYEEGGYDYFEGSSNQLGQNWASYYDPSQNPSPGPGNEGKCDSGAITGNCP